METGWLVSIILGVVLAVVVIAVVIWVIMRRQGQHELMTTPPVEHETPSEHEKHSLSQHVNDRWDSLLSSWEQEHTQHTPSARE